MNESRLEDLLELIVDHRGKTPKKLGGDFVGQGVPVVSAINVKACQLRLDTPLRYVTSDMYRRWMPAELHKGDVLLTSEAPLGEVARVPSNDPLVLGQRLFGLRGRGGLLDNGYLFYALQWKPIRDRLASRATGTTVTGIRQAELVRVSIPVPPFSEQRAIAEVLGTLDDKIEANRCAASKAERLGVGVAGAIARSTAVGEVAFQRRQLVSTTFFADQQVEYFSLPAFDAGCLPLVQDGDGIKSGKFLLERPTVLVSKLNPHIPRVWMAAPTGRTLAITSTEFVGLVPAADYPVEVLWALCASAEFTAQLAEMVKGTTGSHQRVSAEDMLALEIPDPRALPVGAIETITAAVRLAGGLREESERLAGFRDTVLPRLMSGELRVRDADELGGEGV